MVTIKRYSNDSLDMLKSQHSTCEAGELNSPTVKQSVECWLNNKRKFIAHSTMCSYESKSKFIIKHLGSIPLSEIDRRHIHAFLNICLEHYKHKTINEILIVLRGIFCEALDMGVIKVDPLARLGNFLVSFDEADPFTKSEIGLFLSTRTSYESEVNLFKFGVALGLRISELIALAWEDIDLVQKTVHVKRALVKGVYKTPKTRGSDRILDLNDAAFKIISSQRHISFGLAPTHIKLTPIDSARSVTVAIRPVFTNSNTFSAFSSENAYNRFFKRHLEKAGIRYRGPKHLRHTFASQMFTSGLSATWIARNMGHTTTAMLHRHYARWIREDAAGNETKAGQRLAELFDLNDSSTQQLQQNPSPYKPTSDTEAIISVLAALLQRTTDSPVSAEITNSALQLLKRYT